MNRGRVACIGLGFIGIYTAVSFCEQGQEVAGVDVDQTVVNEVNAGELRLNIDDHPYDIEEYVEAGLLTASVSVNRAPPSDTYVISVPTPLSDDSSPDLAHLRAATESIANTLSAGDLVVIQSTVYPACCREVVVPILESSGMTVGEDFGVSYVPERYSPGNQSSIETPRVVGSISERWLKETIALYRPIVDSLVQVSSLENAETVKQIENIQRDVNIALMNELHKICHHWNINTREVLDAAGTKWNFHPYEPGMGVGGHCIPVDPHYFLSAVRETDVTPAVISTARQINEEMPAYHADALKQTLHAHDRDPSTVTIAVLGITYKPGVQDIRNSPALAFGDAVEQWGAETTVYDPTYPSGVEIPVADQRVNRGDVWAAVDDADVVVLGTPHEELIDLDIESLTESMADQPIVLDPYRAFEQPDDPTPDVVWVYGETHTIDEVAITQT